MTDPIAPLIEGSGAFAPALASIREGYLLHYREGVPATPAEPDLRLLEGDHRYAIGLERLAGLGDPGAVAVLAELISACARIHAENADAVEAAREADAAWQASIARLGEPVKR